MRKFVSAIGLAAIALVVWNAFPDYRPVFTRIALAVLAHNAVWQWTQTSARRRLSEELQDIGSKVENSAEKLELLDRKMNALLEDAIQRRRR